MYVYLFFNGAILFGVLEASKPLVFTRQFLLGGFAFLCLSMLFLSVCCPNSGGLFMNKTRPFSELTRIYKKDFKYGVFKGKKMY